MKLCGEEDEMRICKADIEDHLPPFWNGCLVIIVIVDILAESTNIHSNEALCLLFFASRFSAYGSNIMRNCSIASLVLTRMRNSVPLLKKKKSVAQFQIKLLSHLSLVIATHFYVQYQTVYILSRSKISTFVQ